MGNFQFELVTATIRSQTTLSNKQNSDSGSSVVANALLQNEYNEATTVLNTDQQTTEANSPSSGNWNSTQTNAFNSNNAIYQNDSAISQTGESNASTATQQLQTQISTDATNLSNLVSLAQTIIAIGGYTAQLISSAYT